MVLSNSNISTSASAAAKSKKRGAYKKALDLKGKLEVIDKFRASGSTQAEFARMNSISTSTLSDFIKNEDKLRFEVSLNVNSSRIRDRLTGNAEIIDARVYAWFSYARSLHCSVNNKLLQQKALIVARNLGDDDFKASNGWLHKFKTRHNIFNKVLSGIDNLLRASNIEYGDIDGNVPVFEVDPTWETTILNGTFHTPTDTHEPEDVELSEETNVEQAPSTMGQIKKTWSVLKEQIPNSQDEAPLLSPYDQAICHVTSNSRKQKKIQSYFRPKSTSTTPVEVDLRKL